MNIKIIYFTLFISVIWSVSHIIGFWEYDFVSIIFPLLWCIVLSFAYDKLDANHNKNKDEVEK